MAPFNLSNVPELTPSWALPPALKILSPQTPSSHSNANVSLDFVVNKEVSWMGYSLDGKNNVTVAGNFSLSGLNAGMHNVTVYANDSFGNVGASETINFSVTLTKEPFPTTLVVVSVVSVIVIAAGLTIYFKKRNTKKAELEKS
jgi:hypothetical protein